MQEHNASTFSQMQMSEDENPVSLLKHPEKFRNKFMTYSKRAYRLLKAQEYQQTIIFLTKSLELYEMGSELLSDFSPYWKLCLYGNFACAYQRMWQIDNCNQYCEKVQTELENLLKNDSRNQFILNFLKSLIKMRFERCAVLSQLNQHQKAMETCKTIFSLLEKFITILLKFIQGRMVKHQEKKPPENIFFNEQVYQFALSIVESLLKDIKDSVSAQPSLKSSFYFWAKNPEKNEEQVIKKFVGSQNEMWKRSILGVTKTQNWIDQFNIGTIMHINEFHIQDFEKPNPVEEYIFKDKIYQTVIFCSLAHFTLATETRFIELTKRKDQIKIPKEIKGNLKSINRKYGYEQNTEAFLTSERHHIRAINIVAKKLQSTIPYLTHIIRSYEKHYINNKPLEKIASIAQQSALSLQTQKSQKNNSNVSQNSSRQDDNYFFLFNTEKNIKKKKIKTQQNMKSLFHQQNTTQNLMKDQKVIDNLCQFVQNSEVLLKPINDKLNTKFLRKKSRTKSKHKVSIKQLFKKEKSHKKTESNNRSKSMKLRTKRKDTERVKQLKTSRRKQKQSKVKAKSSSTSIRNKTIRNPQNKNQQY